MSNVMMKCGHAANGQLTGIGNEKLDPPIPACVICTCYEQADPPNLEGREAECTYSRTRDGRTHTARVPSQVTLAFFDYRGPGSWKAQNFCKNCGYYKVAHERQEQNVDPRSVVERGECKGFEPHGPFEFDAYYCGCWGWD